jgi:hypothetical protein
MADGTDKDGAYAARMDEWVAGETVEEQPRAAKGNSCTPPRGVTFWLRCTAVCFVLLYMSLPHSLVRGARTPRPAQRTAEGGGFLML